MGITGLIPFLESASTPVDVRDIQGSSVAVDSYCWLHKGVFGCAEKLARGEETDIYVNYCLKYVDMLTKHKIKVIMVFDGRHLPAKAETERRRREARQESRKLAKEYLRRNEIEKARSHMKRAIDVTHEMALRLIKACRERGVDCIVAPYEADAQMAWLNKAGLAEYIITEDSDLTLFGAEKILFKLDLNGYALLVEKTKLNLAMGCKPEKYTFDKFRRMCILSGCDYLDSLPGIGLKKACKFMLTTEEDDMTKALKKLPLYLKMKQLNVSDEYIEQFLKAEATFNHMFVYNPLIRRMERLCDLNEFQTEEKYCSNAGTLMEDQEQAFQLALGNLNPFSLKQLDDWHPDKEWSNIANNKKKLTKHKSIWNSHASKLYADNKPKEERCVGTIFKKIEYKNMADMEIQENIAHERLKLEEAEVFSMYSIQKEITVTAKRKRAPTDSTDDEEEVKKSHAEEIETPSKPLNPFAITNSSVEKKHKSHVCANKSLLKVLSPRKDSDTIVRNFNTAKIDVKSRFFTQNIKQAVKKPFAARDLTGEMTKIEEKSIKCLEIQRALYLDLSPQSNKGKSNIQNVGSYITQTNESCNKEADLEQHTDTNQLNNSKDTLTSNPSSPAKATNDVILLSGDEDDEDKSKVASSQNSTNSSLVSGTRRIGLSKPKSTEKSAKKVTAIDSKQPTLSMFGFQKRPTIKKI